MFDDQAGAADRADAGDPAASGTTGWAVPGVPLPTGPSWVADPAPQVSGIVGEVLVAVRALRALSSEAATAQERAAWLTGLRQVVDAAEVAFTEVLGAFDAHGDAQLLAAAPSTASWCRRQLRMAPGDVSGRVRLARLAVAEPAMDAALEQTAAGLLRYEQVRQVARSVRCLDAAVHPLADDTARRRRGEAVEILSTLAVTEDPSVLAAAGRRIADVVNPDGALASREEQAHRRYLQLSPLLDGMTALDGVLDAEGAATVSAALAPLLVPAGPDDRRSTAQRRADALVDVAALALRTQELPTLSGTSATIDVVVTADALAAGRLLEAARSGEPAGSDPAGGGRLSPPRVAAAEASTIADPEVAGPGGVGERPAPSEVADWLRSPWRALTGPAAGGVVPGAPGGAAVVPVATVARWLCEGTVGRIVLGTDSLPLDVGRRQRLFSSAQRRALLLRDAGCRAPGCDRPARYTDAHHLTGWQDGGTTDLANALLLCRYHHTLIHLPADNGGWRLRAVDGARGSNGPLVFTGPAGQTLVTAARGP